MMTYIRNALEKDAAEIAEIEKDCFSLPWSEGSVLSEIQSRESVFLVAKKQKSIVGYISAKNISGEIYINNIAVKRECRNGGIATALLDTMISYAENEDCSFITLEVRVSNSAARRLYENFGFRFLGERKDFYSLPTENAAIYTLYLKEENE